MVDMDPAGEVASWTPRRRGRAVRRAQTRINVSSLSLWAALPPNRDARLVMLLAACGQDVLDLPNAARGFNDATSVLLGTRGTSTEELGYLSLNMTEPENWAALGVHQNARPWMTIRPIVARLSQWALIAPRLLVDSTEVELTAHHRQVLTVVAAALQRQARHNESRSLDSSSACVPLPVEPALTAAFCVAALEPDQVEVLTQLVADGSMAPQSAVADLATLAEVARRL